MQSLLTYRDTKKVLLIIGGLVVLIGIATVCFANSFILSNYNQYTDDVSQLSTSTIGIIFGGGVTPDGELGEMLEDRMAAGYSLYEQGVVNRLLITGDGGMNIQDEITPMYQYLLDRNVPAQSILVDRYSFKTYDSCYRAAAVFGVEEAILVSQQFHVPRMLYLCESFGIESRGLTSDLREYDNWWTPGPRERLARLKAMWEVEVTRPEPRVSEARRVK